MFRSKSDDVLDTSGADKETHKKKKKNFVRKLFNIRQLGQQQNHQPQQQNLPQQQQQQQREQQSRRQSALSLQVNGNGSSNGNVSIMTTTAMAKTLILQRQLQQHQQQQQQQQQQQHGNGSLSRQHRNSVEVLSDPCLQQTPPVLDSQRKGKKKNFLYRLFAKKPKSSKKEHEPQRSISSIIPRSLPERSAATAASPATESPANIAAAVVAKKMADASTQWSLAVDDLSTRAGDDEAAPTSVDAKLESIATSEANNDTDNGDDINGDDNDGHHRTGTGVANDGDDDDDDDDGGGDGDNVEATAASEAPCEPTNREATSEADDSGFRDLLRLFHGELPVGSDFRAPERFHSFQERIETDGPRSTSFYVPLETGGEDRFRSILVVADRKGDSRGSALTPAFSPSCTSSSSSNARAVVVPTHASIPTYTPDSVTKIVTRKIYLKPYLPTELKEQDGQESAPNFVCSMPELPTGFNSDSGDGCSDSGGDSGVRALPSVERIKEMVRAKREVRKRHGPSTKNVSYFYDVKRRSSGNGCCDTGDRSFRDDKWSEDSTTEMQNVPWPLLPDILENANQLNGEEKEEDGDGGDDETKMAAARSGEKPALIGSLTSRFDSEAVSDSIEVKGNSTIGDRENEKRSIDSPTTRAEEAADVGGGSGCQPGSCVTSVRKVLFGRTNSDAPRLRPPDDEGDKRHPLSRSVSECPDRELDSSSSSSVGFFRHRPPPGSTSLLHLHSKSHSLAWQSSAMRNRYSRQQARRMDSYSSSQDSRESLFTGSLDRLAAPGCASAGIPQHHEHHYGAHSNIYGYNSSYDDHVDYVGAARRQESIRRQSHSIVSGSESPADSEEGWRPPPCPIPKVALAKFNEDGTPKSILKKKQQQQLQTQQQQQQRQ